MDNIRLTQLCKQGVTMGLFTDAEISVETKARGVQSLRGKDRDDFVAFLVGKFGSLYSLFTQNGILHIVGGQNVREAATYLMRKLHKKPYLWSNLLPRSVGGNTDTNEIKESAIEGRNYLAVVRGTINYVDFDPLSPVKPAKSKAPILSAKYTVTVDKDGTVGGFGLCRDEAADTSYTLTTVPPEVKKAVQDGAIGGDAVQAVNEQAKELATKVNISLAQATEAIQHTARAMMAGALAGYQVTAIIHDEVMVEGEEAIHMLCHSTVERIDGEVWITTKGARKPPVDRPRHWAQRLWGEK